jgi:hypothetical protein
MSAVGPTARPFLPLLALFSGAVRALFLASLSVGAVFPWTETFYETVILLAISAQIFRAFRFLHACALTKTHSFVVVFP